MKDADFLLAVLEDGREHTWHEIMRRSQTERGCGLTIHSRAAELRRRGHTILCRSERVNGRTVSVYRLVSSSAAPNPPPYLADDDRLGGRDDATLAPRPGTSSWGAAA